MVTLLVFTSGAFGAEPGSLIKDQPLEVTSGRLEADDAAHKVTFFDKVVARQGELMIYADTLTIFYAGAKREVERIVAEKDVRIVQQNRVVTGERAEYDHRAGTVELTGSPAVHQGKDAVSGDKITVYLNENRSVISSKDGSRVNALFHPNEAKP
jgi:lipopolysaccharide export system protein LptA